MKTREVKLHEVSITFLVPEYEIGGAIRNGQGPDIIKEVDDGERSALNALSWMFVEALSGNAVGSLATEEMRVEIDGKLIIDVDAEDEPETPVS